MYLALRQGASQGRPQEVPARAGAEAGAEEAELDGVEARGRPGETKPWWPQDQLVSDMAIHLALMVEQLGLSASPNDWTQVRCSSRTLTRRHKAVCIRALRLSALGRSSRGLLTIIVRGSPPFV